MGYYRFNYIPQNISHTLFQNTNSKQIQATKTLNKFYKG